MKKDEKSTLPYYLNNFLLVYIAYLSNFGSKTSTTWLLPATTKIDQIPNKKNFSSEFIKCINTLKNTKEQMRRKKKNKKIIPLNLKSLGNDISAYPFVEIEWLDIEGDAGWSTTKDLNKEKLPTCVSKGYLVSQQNGVTRIFTDYIKSKDKPTFDSIGNTTIIPTSVIESIKKIN